MKSRGPEGLYLKVQAQRAPKLLVTNNLNSCYYVLLHLQNMKRVYLGLLLFHPGLVVGREEENFCCKDRKTEKVSLTGAD